MGKFTKGIQKKTQNGSGARAGQPQGSGAADASQIEIGGKVALTEGERQALQKIDQTSGQLKVALANVELQIVGLSRTKAEIVSELEKQAALMRDQAEAVLRSHGGDPADKERAWSVSLSEMAITRTA